MHANLPVNSAARATRSLAIGVLQSELACAEKKSILVSGIIKNVDWEPPGI